MCENSGTEHEIPIENVCIIKYWTVRTRGKCVIIKANNLSLIPRTLLGTTSVNFSPNNYILRSVTDFCKAEYIDGRELREQTVSSVAHQRPPTSTMPPKRHSTFFSKFLWNITSGLFAPKDLHWGGRERNRVVIF